jgi:hypothetical protein
MRLSQQIRRSIGLIAQTLSENGKSIDGFLLIPIGAENTTWQFSLKA